jgi:hypothetical protein
MNRIDRMISDAQLMRDGLRRNIEDWTKKVQQIHDGIETAKGRLTQLDVLLENLKSFKSTKGIEVLEQILAANPLPSESNPAYFARLESEHRQPLPPEEVAETARRILKEVGHPLKRGQLVKEFAARHIPLAGKDKNKNLGTILWRHGNMFVSLDGLGYWPKDVPLKGVYTPEGAEEADLFE